MSHPRKPREDGAPFIWKSDANTKTGKAGSPSSMRLSLGDFVYLVIACIAGVCQAWCVGWGINAAWSLLMGVPFTLASYVHASSKTGVKSLDWKRMLLLWLGMPLSLGIGALTMGAETAAMYALGFGTTDLPLHSVRLLIGEGCACLLWAKCLQLWSLGYHTSRPKYQYLRFFILLYLSVVIAYALSLLIHKVGQKNPYFLLTSVFVTVTSGVVLLLQQNEVNTPYS